MAEDLDEASNELIITDEDSVRYSVGETFVTVENDEVGAPGDGGRQGWKKPNEKPKKKTKNFLHQTNHLLIRSSGIKKVRL